MGLVNGDFEMVYDGDGMHSVYSSNSKVVQALIYRSGKSVRPWTVDVFHFSLSDFTSLSIAFDSVCSYLRSRANA